MRNMIFIGAQGAGKGTCASLLKDELGIPHISTGDMFRAAIKNQTPVGLEAKGYIDKGELVPDEVTVKLVKERISQPDAKDGFILDGFPRNLAQAEALDAITTITDVVYLEVTDDTVVERISSRIQCRKCGEVYNKLFNKPEVEGKCGKCGGELYTREDDQPEAIKKRLAIFHGQTAPLFEFYEKKGVVRRVDANPNVIETVVDNVRNALKEAE
ncbi:adenylate kinase [Candidatus Woesearchaeota archaeon]|nr:adenylate kinase [Candidatus Woesearchaeota archaeon]